VIVILEADSAERVAAARELFLEYQRGLGLDLCFQGFQSELDGLPGDYAPPRGRLLLAEDGGVAIGCVALRPVDSATCEMKRLYVRPAGQGRGLGRALVDRLLAEARAIGYARVVLDTLPQMATAQRMYERLGFHDIPPYRPNPVPGARYLGLDLDGG
jgi:ribosomal protein S18 acetylase RimI-like enzyme